MTHLTHLVSNKIALTLLAALVLFVLMTVFLMIITSAGAIDIAGISTMKYCVSSGSVCTGV